jgi:KUP system potassium uptake protein
MEDSEHSNSNSRNLTVLVLGALGVVYGDLGTSPLYAFHECFAGSHNLEASAGNVFGVLSLIFWGLTIVISIKYMVFVMRADNRGEGGILALMALALSKLAPEYKKRRLIVTTMGLFGAALLYGDGMITPAISVLSSVEGLNVATDVFSSYVVPITIVILVVLFMIQRRGTGQIGIVFGPVILLWFATIGILGLVSIVHNPSILQGLNPIWALRFFWTNKIHGFFVLGAVFLALTGGEALYADMGHFGRRPIQIGWYCVALPGLLLNYLGQGALILSSPDSLSNPFFALAPRWGLYPMVALSAAATIIASQAVISGAFSLTRQAVLLGYLPRIPIVHTSSHEIGQIYVPITNRVLFVATVGLVLAFRTSTNLAAAYGVAVTMTMLITTLILYVVARHVWGWGRAMTRVLLVGFLVIDVAFCSSALAKIPEGGWFPLVAALGVYILMSTWRKGRQILGARLYQRVPPLDDFVTKIIPAEANLTRVPGAAIFMSGNPLGTPPVLLHNIKYNRVVHETVAIMNVVVEEAPHVKHSERLKVENLGYGFYRVRARYGFMESPNVKEVLDLCAEQGLKLDEMTTGFFLGRESIVITNKPGMAKWRQSLFALMARNAQGASPFFEIPPNQVVELGVQVQL